jgi:phage terminase small subunit
MTDTTTPSTDVVAAARAARVALSRRQQAFVEFYARPGEKHGEPCLNAAAAVRLAGYSHKRAEATAFKLLRQPKVRAAVDAMRAEIAALNGYDAAKCMAELEDAMAHARKTENSSALVRAIELRGKISSRE